MRQSNTAGSNEPANQQNCFYRLVYLMHMPLERTVYALLYVYVCFIRLSHK